MQYDVLKFAWCSVRWRICTFLPILSHTNASALPLTKSGPPLSDFIRVADNIAANVYFSAYSMWKSDKKVYLSATKCSNYFFFQMKTNVKEYLVVLLIDSGPNLDMLCYKSSLINSTQVLFDKSQVTHS